MKRKAGRSKKSTQAPSKSGKAGRGLPAASSRVRGMPSRETREKRSAERLLRRVRQQEVLARLGQISIATDDIDMLFRETVKLLTHAFDAEFAKVLEYDREENRLVLVAGYGWKRSVRPHRTYIGAGKDSQAGYSLVVRQPVIVKDYSTEKRFTCSQLLKDHNVKSGMCAVIVGPGRPYGVLGIHSRRPVDFSTDDANFLQSAANVLAMSIVRREAESELRRFQYMAEHANVGVSLIDKEGRIRYANKQTYERLGFTRDEYMRKRVVHKDASDKPKFKSLFSSVQRRPLPPVETFEIKKDGGTLPIEINLTGVTFEGEPYMFAVTQDITERLRSRNNIEFLAKASLMLGSSLDYRETLDKVAETAVSYVADWCSVDMLDEKGDVQLFAVRHKDPEKVAWAIELRKERPVDMTLNQGLPAVLKTGKSELYPHIDDELLVRAAKSKKDLKLMRDIGFNAVMIVPIRVGGKVAGAIQFVTTKESGRDYDRSDLVIAEELANRAALAIENSRLYSEIESQRERLNEIVTNVPGVVWEMWFDQNPSENRVNFASDYVRDMLGYEVEEWLRPAFWIDIIHPEDRAKVLEEREASIKEGKPFTQLFRWVRKDGAAIWVESHVTMIYGSSKRVIGLRGVSMDVTGRIELERRKDEFISMASHELKTPVTTLKVYAQILAMLASKDRDKSMSAHLEKMDLQISRLTDLINDLLDLSKIQTGKLSFKVTTFDLKEVVEEIVSQLQPVMDDHTITIHGDIGRKMSGDRDRISQVLINLLTNAAKYSPNTEDVRVVLSEDERFAYIAVEDRGIGIPADQRDKIFTRFYQVSRNSKRTYPGLGIGLYISDQIARRHGGEILVQSVEGKGSVFTIKLPFRLPKELTKESKARING